MLYVILDFFIGLWTLLLFLNVREGGLTLPDWALMVWSLLLRPAKIKLALIKK
jgi:hypothetical protein